MLPCLLCMWYCEVNWFVSFEIPHPKIFHIIKLILISDNQNRNKHKLTKHVFTAINWVAESVCKTSISQSHWKTRQCGWIQTIQQRRVEHVWCLKLSQSYHIFHFSYWSRNSIRIRWDNYFMIWVIQVMNKSLPLINWAIILKLQFVFYNLNVVIEFDWWCKYDK